MKLWKVLNEDGSAYHGGTGKWELPKNGEPGEWMPWIEEIDPCWSGYHLCRNVDLINWLGPAIYEAEADGEIIKLENKVVCQSARIIRRLDTWTDKTARLFACDCAWAVLPLFESQHQSDMRPMRAINEAYLFAYGLSDSHSLAAARDAARDAARAAARAAELTAAVAAARAAARAAAVDSAWAAAWAAARAAAVDSAWAWQTKRLFEYLYPQKTAHAAANPTWAITTTSREDTP